MQPLPKTKLELRKRHYVTSARPPKSALHLALAPQELIALLAIVVLIFLVITTMFGRMT